MFYCAQWHFPTFHTHGNGRRLVRQASRPEAGAQRRAAHKVGVRKGAIGTSNEADELQRIIGNIHENRFVKDVGVRSGRSPVIIAYTDDQISDLKRFSAASTSCQLRSVIGVDRTFNLGPCYVTLMVFKNMALMRNVSRDNPLFVGPAMFHYDAKQDTYRKFFDVVRDAIANDVLCAEIGGDVDVVLGSDDEKALVNAFSAAFPSAGHVSSNE